MSSSNNQLNSISRGAGQFGGTEESTAEDYQTSNNTGLSQTNGRGGIQGSKQLDNNTSEISNHGRNCDDVVSRGLSGNKDDSINDNQNK